MKLEKEKIIPVFAMIIILVLAAYTIYVNISKMKIYDGLKLAKSSFYKPQRVYYDFIYRYKDKVGNVSYIIRGTSLFLLYKNGTSEAIINSNISFMNFKIIWNGTDYLKCINQNCSFIDEKEAIQYLPERLVEFFIKNGKKYRLKGIYNINYAGALYDNETMFCGVFIQGLFNDDKSAFWICMENGTAKYYLIASVDDKYAESIEFIAKGPWGSR